MPKPDVGWLQALVERYQLRYTERAGHVLGIHHGLCLDIWGDEDGFYIYAFAPQADVKDQILEQFQGFSHIQELGVPTNWIRGNLIGPAELQRDGCMLVLSTERLRSITVEQFLEIPDCLAADFQHFGAQPSVDACRQCGAEAPRNLLLVDALYTTICDDCLEQLLQNAPEGKVRIDHPVRWMRAITTLSIGSLAFIAIWGTLQQPFIKNIDAQLLLLAPAFGGITLAGWVARRAEGISALLRLATVACTLGSTLIGNIWAYRSVLVQQFPVTWSDAAWFYFSLQLRFNADVEAWYLIGGTAGAWIGSDVLKSAGFLRIE